MAMSTATKPLTKTCSPCDPANWVDQVGTEWIRTTCGKCGAFKGWRPINAKTSGKKARRV